MSALRIVIAFSSLGLGFAHAGTQLTVPSAASTMRAPAAIRVDLNGRDVTNPMKHSIGGRLTVRMPLETLGTLGTGKVLTARGLRSQLGAATIQLPGVDSAARATVEKGALVVRAQAPIVDAVMQQRVVPVQLSVGGKTVTIGAQNDRVTINLRPMVLADERSLILDNKTGLADARAHVAASEARAKAMQDPAWKPTATTVTPELKVQMQARAVGDIAYWKGEAMKWQTRIAAAKTRIQTINAHPTVQQLDVAPGAQMSSAITIDGK